MAITTLDGLIAAMLPAEDVWKVGFTGEAIGVYHSLFYLAGRPGAAVVPTPGLAGAALTTYAGQVPFPAAVGGMNIHLARMEASMAAGVGGVVLCDRLWHNSGFTVTSTGAQTVNSVTWPARDNDGATAGAGVQIAVEQYTTGGAGTPTLTMDYTNSAGVGSRTGTCALPTTLTAGTFVPFSLQAGDTGVQSVQTITQSASMTSGSYGLVAYRTMVTVPTSVANVPADRDGIALGLPRFLDNSVPFMLAQLTATSVGVIDCAVAWAQG